MRHLIEKWVARAKAKRAEAAAAEILERSPSEETPFYAEFQPITGAQEDMEMGEITGSFRLIEKAIDKATKETKEAVVAARRVSSTIGLPTSDLPSSK
jgi:hypothetical protein